MLRTSLERRGNGPGTRETGATQEKRTEAAVPRHSVPSRRTGNPGRRQSRLSIPGSQPPCETNCSESWRALSLKEEATAWAQRALLAKNALTTADSGLVEAAFTSKLAGFADGELNEEPLPSPPSPSDGAAIAGATKASVTIGPVASDLSPVAIPAQPPGKESSSLMREKRRRHPASAAAAPADNEVRSAAAEGAVGGVTRRFKVAAEGLVHLIPPLAYLLLGGRGSGDRAGPDHSQRRILDGVVNAQPLKAMQ
jgi:hypothetical protein